MYSLCDTLESSGAVKGSPRSFLRSAGCVFEFYIHILYIDRLARQRATVSCCSIKCFLTRIVKNNDNNGTITLTIIILIMITIIRVHDSNVTLDVRPVMWSSPLMITGQTNPKERDRKVRAKVCTCTCECMQRDKRRL